jgi:hypothetical protein
MLAVIKIFFNNKKYFTLRLISSIISLLFALWYSKLLGIFGKSILVYIFTLSTLVQLLFLGTMFLNLKKIKHISSDLKTSFNTLVIYVFFLAFTIYTVGLLVYFKYINYFQVNLFMLSLLYFVISWFFMALVESCVVNKKYYVSSIINSLAVILSLIFFLFFLVSDIFTVASSVLLSFIASYSVTMLIFKIRSKIKLNEIQFTSPKLFFTQKSNLASFNLQNIFFEKFDKIFLSYFFTLGTLAPYSVVLSLTSTLRFVPEHFSNLIVTSHIKKNLWKNYFSLKNICISFFGIFSLVFAIDLLVENSLGSAWNLPYLVLIAIVLQEFLRAVYQLISINVPLSSMYNFKKSVLLCSSTSGLVYIAAYYFGLIGVPLSFCLIYICLLIYLFFKEKQYE